MHSRFLKSVENLSFECKITKIQVFDAFLNFAAIVIVKTQTPKKDFLNRPPHYQQICMKKHLWCHGSTAAAMPTVMLDHPGSNPGVNHGCMYSSRRTNVFCLVVSNYVVLQCIVSWAKSLLM
jgi:hypothetical protein